MPSARFRRRLFASLRVALLLACGVAVTRGDEAAPNLAPTDAARSDRQLISGRGASARRNEEGGRSTGGWWLGTAGIALALAACGAISVASRRYLPQNNPALLRVVGRTSLSPKHTVYLLQAGPRVLIVGAGPQGAPSLLGELADVDVPDGQGLMVSVPAATGISRGRFDRRTGDDR
jgi:hypothetical protein